MFPPRITLLIAKALKRLNNFKNMIRGRCWPPFCPYCDHEMNWDVDYFICDNCYKQMDEETEIFDASNGIVPWKVIIKRDINKSSAEIYEDNRLKAYIYKWRDKK
jgi:hypothetical protein